MPFSLIKDTHCHTFIVDQNGNGNFTTIQEAVNYVASSSLSFCTIFINPGSYNENVTLPPMTPSCVIHGSSKNKISTIVNGKFTIMSSKWGIENLWIMYNGVDDYGIDADSSLEEVDIGIVNTAISNFPHAVRMTGTVNNCDLKLLGCIMIGPGAPGTVGITKSTPGFTSFVGNCYITGYETGIDISEGGIDSFNNVFTNCSVAIAQSGSATIYSSCDSMGSATTSGIIELSHRADNVYYDNSVTGAPIKNVQGAIDALSDKLVSTAGSRSTLLLTDEGTNQLLIGSTGDLRISGFGRTNLGDQHIANFEAYITKGIFNNIGSETSKLGWAIGSSHPTNPPTGGLLAYSQGTCGWGTSFNGWPLSAIRLGSASGVFDNVGVVFLGGYADIDGMGGNLSFEIFTCDSSNPLGYVTNANAGEMTSGCVHHISNNSSVAAIGVDDSTLVCTNLNADLLDGHHSDSFEQVLTFNYPLNRSGNTVNLNYNTTNLKLTSNELNTIQDISTDSSPSFSGLNLSDQLVSTLPTGTAPIFVSSLTVCNNLNADLLDGKHASNLISDETFGASWNGVTDVAPSKNAIYDALTDGTTADIYVKSLKTANYLYSASDLRIKVGVINAWTIVYSSGNLVPTTDLAVDIGSTGNRVNAVYAQSFQARNSTDSGTYIGMFKSQGVLPGFPTNYYPVIRTNHIAIYFSAGDRYTGYIEQAGEGGNVVVRTTSSSYQGNFIGLFKGQGSLPGYPSNYYPTVKTDFTYLYFSTNGVYSGYHNNTGWYYTSSVELKENFKTPEEINVLDKIKQLDIKQYNYKGDDPLMKHVGPMAESFNTIMETGLTSDKEADPNNIGMLNVADVAGTALAGVQELIKRVEMLEEKLNKLTG